MSARAAGPVVRTLPLLLLALAGAGRSAAQLGLEGARSWHAGSDGLSTTPEAGAWLGHAAVAGDFDGDGFDDVALALPRGTVGADAVAGQVLVLYGADGGLVADGHQVFDQDSVGVADSAEPNDFFGWSLAAGDFDADGFDDLVVGVPFEDLGGFDSAGALHVFPGSPAGLTTTEALAWNQETAGVADASEPGDQFGAALAVGDFDDDGYDDLAVGSPGESLEGAPSYVALGALHVFFGGPGGATTADSRFLRPGDGVVILPPPAASLEFAAALAAGRFFPVGGDQLVVGVPRATVDGASSAGLIAVLNNLRTGGTELGIYSQASTGVPGVPEAGDNFGGALAVGHFDGGARGSLAVGSPGEDVGPANGAGAFHVLTDLFSGAFAATIWTQDSLSPGAAEADDRFGAELAVGDFDADGFPDLAIGSPGETLGGVPGFGGGAVLYGSADGITAAGFQGLPLGLVEVSTDLQFGYTLAPGRFSGHSGDDLVIGMPRADIQLETDAGSSLVYFSIALFRDGFESGDSDRWSSAVP